MDELERVKFSDHFQSYQDSGKVLYEDPSQGIVIRQGYIYEAPTVKGGTNLIVAMRVYDGWMFYMHADRCKKTQMHEFVRAIASGDIQPRSLKQVDVERLAQCAIGLEAFANHRTTEQHIDYMEEEAFRRHRD